tara:strand:- start:13627 stop:14208 length:582 start_codon:yes stop_codon:yes gene_type:complete
MKPLSQLLLLCLAASISLSCSPSDSPSGDSEATSPFSQVTNQLQAIEAGEISKLHTLNGVFLASQPAESDLAQAKTDGVKTVVNLRHDEEIKDFAEKEVVENLGMTYIHLPWNGEEELTDAIFDQSREVLKNAEKPMLIHCKSANRNGAVWLPYRVLDGGLTVEEALAEAKTVGLTSAKYEARALDYISRKSS